MKAWMLIFPRNGKDDMEIEETSHDPADSVVAMAHGLSTQTHARGLPELVKRCKSGLAARQKHIVSRAVRRADEVQFVEVVLNACFAEHGANNHTATDAADG